MIIENLKLIDFRNYSQTYLEFHPNLNILVGKNGQGKTNILEAIYLLSIGKAFRASKDYEAISFNSQMCYISGTYKDLNSHDLLEFVISKKGKKAIKRNKVSLQKISDIFGGLCVVLFSPEDLRLIKDGPKERRKFIDREIIQIYPRYYDYLSSYNKILDSRNKLLKTINDENLLEVYDIQLANFGSKVYEYRFKFVEKLAFFAKKIHSNLTQSIEELSIEYENQLKEEGFKDIESIRNSFLNQLKENRAKDIQKRSTSVGPHRDDLQVKINGVDVRTYGSQGQQRTSSISLKLSQIEFIYSEKQEYPILLLDDVLSELDPKRQEFLVETFKFCQVFLTSAEESHISIFKKKSKKVFFVDKGLIKKEE